MPAASGNGLSLTAPGPEDLPAAETSYLEVRLAATSSQGASATVIQELRPTLVRLSFASEPSGLELRADGTAFTTPKTITSWQGYAFTIEAPSQTGPSGGLYEFDSWSDGGEAAHGSRLRPPTARTRRASRSRRPGSWASTSTV